MAKGQGNYVLTPNLHNHRRLKPLNMRLRIDRRPTLRAEKDAELEAVVLMCRPYLLQRA